MVARKLRARGAEVRALVRSRERAASLARLGVELALGDFGHPDTLVSALRGVAAAVDAVIAHGGEVGQPIGVESHGGAA